MKNFSKAISAFCLTFVLSVISTLSPLKSTIAPSIDLSCGSPAFVVESQIDAPATLTILEASCSGEHGYKAQIELKNTSENVILGYDVADVSTYQNKRKNLFSQGQYGGALQPGELVILYCNAGFTNGLSYGKPVGELQKVVFRIEKIEMTNGTVWKLDKSKK